MSRPPSKADRWGRAKAATRLVMERENGAERPDVSRVYQWIEEQADPALAEEMRAYVEEGRPLELPDRVRTPNLTQDPESGFYTASQ